jgi:antitoxin component of MazEF toxin-antitoxin module
MIKTLKKVGNSHSVTLDKALMEQMGIKTGSKLSLHLDGRNLVLTPVDDRIDDATFDAALDAGMTRYAEALKRLS